MEDKSEVIQGNDTFSEFTKVILPLLQSGDDSHEKPKYERYFQKGQNLEEEQDLIGAKKYFRKSIKELVGKEGEELAKQRQKVYIALIHVNENVSQNLQCIRSMSSILFSNL